MRENNEVRERSMEFAVRIVNMCKYLSGEKREKTMSSQLLRSGTSVGANIREAIYAQSRKDFIEKMSIALKEISETEYWIELLYRCEYLDERQYESIVEDAKVLVRMLTSIVKSTKENV